MKRMGREVGWMEGEGALVPAALPSPHAAQRHQPATCLQNHLVLKKRPRDRKPDHPTQARPRMGHVPGASRVSLGIPLTGCGSSSESIHSLRVPWAGVRALLGAMHSSPPALHPGAGPAAAFLRLPFSWVPFSLWGAQGLREEQARAVCPPLPARWPVAVAGSPLCSAPAL